MLTVHKNHKFKLIVMPVISFLISFAIMFVILFFNIKNVNSLISNTGIQFAIALGVGLGLGLLIWIALYIHTAKTDLSKKERTNNLKMQQSLGVSKEITRQERKAEKLRIKNERKQLNKDEYDLNYDYKTSEELRKLQKTY
ncbi:hypothetical protein [Spiroplasma endosymbiont of Labia minor]|uniref:hypothetical protein n=1 Tax=Spiroplasma endosymbiont of Labia minor TaxID=3066305 RepID=UPI0030D392BC